MTIPNKPDAQALLIAAAPRPLVDDATVNDNVCTVFGAGHVDGSSNTPFLTGLHRPVYTVGLKFQV